MAKLRNTHLNSIMMSKKGGRHFSPATDYKRAHEQGEIRRELEAADEEMEQEHNHGKYEQYDTF